MRTLRSHHRFWLVFLATLFCLLGVIPPGQTYMELRRPSLALHFDGAQPFANGRAVVKQGSWHGYIDHSGNLVIPLRYREARNFNEGLAAVELGEKWGFIDKKGNSITKAARIFGINRATVYRWLDRPNLERTRVVRRQRKIDIARLNQDVEKYPDKTLQQRAQEFGVVPSSIYYQLKRLNITRKKTVSLSRKKSFR